MHETGSRPPLPPLPPSSYPSLKDLSNSPAHIWQSLVSFFPILPLKSLGFECPLPHGVYNDLRVNSRYYWSVETMQSVHVDGVTFHSRGSKWDFDNMEDSVKIPVCLILSVFTPALALAQWISITNEHE